MTHKMYASFMVLELSWSVYFRRVKNDIVGYQVHEFICECFKLIWNVMPVPCYSLFFSPHWMK